MNATAPAGWLYNFTPSPLDVPAGGSVVGTLVVYIPDDATSGARFPLALQAWSDGGLGGALSEALPLNVSVLAPPPPAQKAAPQVTLSIGPASAPAGSLAEGRLSLLSGEPTKLDAKLSVSGDAAWAPRLAAGDEFRSLYYEELAEARVLARVPASAAPGSVRAFTVTAVVDGFAFSVVWNVTAEEALPPTPATADARDDPTPAAVTTPPTVAASTDAGPILPDHALDASAVPTRLDVQSGGSADGAIRVTNVGAKALRLALTGDAGDRWPVLFDPATLTLEPGESRDVVMTVHAPAGLAAGGSGSGTVTISGDEGLLRTVPFQLRILEGVRAFEPKAPATQGDAPAPRPLVVDTATVAIVGGLGAVGAAALVVANRPLREKLLWGALGLYTRLARPDVLGHDERQRLYALVEQTPGMHFHALQRALAWNTGTLTYHLRVLEKHGFVVSRRDGPYRRFYVQGAAPRKEAFSVDAPHGLRADVIEAIRNSAGISQTDLSLALGANKQTVNYHVKALERQGAIRVEKRGRETFLYATSAPGTGPGEVPA